VAELERKSQRALRLISGGNPLHSVTGRELERAVAQLELLVAIDVYPSATCARADYVLPATDMLEIGVEAGLAEGCAATDGHATR
jgi:anaerobic selenocysteine-containing dehydrogenase